MTHTRTGPLRPLNTQQFDKVAEALKQEIPAAMPSDRSLARLAEFEDFVIGAFVNVVLKNYLPPLGSYLSVLFDQFPQVRQGIANTMGQLGIKALGGVAVVLCKPFPSATVHKAWPTLYGILMHHLMEVVSDKLSSKDLVKLLCVPDDLVEVFNELALSVLTEDSFQAIQPQFIEYLSHCTLEELNHNKFYNSLLAKVLLNDTIFQAVRHVNPTIRLEDVTRYTDSPIRYGLLLNLFVIENAKVHLENITVFHGHHRPLQNTGRAVLYDLAMRSLLQRYNMSSFLHRYSYMVFSAEQAVEMRADSILADYTMACMISGFAAADVEVRLAVLQKQSIIEQAIHKGTCLIGLANDCGWYMMQMSGGEIMETLDALLDREADVRDLRAYFAMMKQRIDPSDPLYRAYYPIFKDASKGEDNMALDMRVLSQADPWTHFAHNVVSLAEVFKTMHREMELLLSQIGHDGIAQLIRNFVHYNFQIYDAATDYDAAIPLIGQLPIITDELAQSG